MSATDPAGLQARIAELVTELRDLRAQLDVAAVALAEGEPGAGDALAEVESRISAAVRERAVLEAALRGIEARASQAATDAQVRAIESAAAAMPAAAGAVAEHWRAALGALRAFAEARRELHKAAGRLRTLAAECRNPLATGDLLDRPPLDRSGPFRADSLDGALGAVLFYATDEGLTSRVVRGIAPASAHDTEAAVLKALQGFVQYAGDVARQNAERLQAKPEAA